VGTARIKVFYLIERLARAGTELHLLKILKHLDRSRFDPVLCCLSEEMTDKSLLSLLPPGMPVHMLEGKWNLLRPSTLLLYQQVKRLLRQERPDILHCFLFVANVMGAFAARSAGVRGVVDTRGRMGIEWEAHWLHRYLQRAADRRCGLIICKTEAMRQEIARVERAPLDKIHVMPNGVDTTHFQYTPDAAASSRSELEKQFGLPVEGPLVLAVGNLKPIKDHMTQVRAAAQLIQQFPKVQVVVLGDGESRDELHAAVAEMNLKETMRLPGAVDDVRPWMRAADVFVAPSVSEGMPNAVLEAMAMGLSLVLSDIPGHREIINDDAWYFAPRDAAGLAAALGAALSSPGERAKRGQIGLARVRTEMSLEALVRKLEGMYEAIGGATASSTG
jgi:L-malate glycosyltransferase